mmetsp:Transcript_42781/g.84393  ORF Transcript_42781/g.84393 Transcript_42781/m.84393 type:complete len:82 (-) Transcript_42781:134-379(-)
MHKPVDGFFRARQACKKSWFAKGCAAREPSESEGGTAERPVSLFFFSEILQAPREERRVERNMHTHVYTHTEGERKSLVER